jgi:hypothetical protein
MVIRLLEKRLKGIRLIKVRVYEDEDLYVEVTDK